MKSFKEILRPQINEEEENVTIEDLKDLLEDLDPEDYAEVAELIVDLIEGEYDFEDDLDGVEFNEFDYDDDDYDYDDDDYDDEDLDEAVSARFRNKKKGLRKFSKTASQLKKEKIKNKIKNRKNRIKNKLYRKKNKMKIKKYQKSRNSAIKRGLHTTKKRIGA